MGIRFAGALCRSVAPGLRRASQRADAVEAEAILARTGVPASRALMIGDRMDRDAAAARRAGVPAWILSRRSAPGVRSFRGYDDPVFGPLLATPMRARAG